MTWKEGTRITPQRLPAARDSIIRQMQQTITTAYANIASAQMLQSYQQDVQHLKTAPLWWVSHDMFLLALDAAESHTEPREQTAPTPTGFIYVDGQLPSFTERGVIFPHVCAISWISEPNAKVGVQFYTNQIDPGWNSPLMPFEPEPEYIASPGFQRLKLLAVRLLKAIWALSAIPTITDVSHTRQTKTDKPVREHNTSKPNNVTIVMLRQTSQTPEDTIDPNTRKPYTHRFIVRGFYRNQAYGKNRSLRRRQWIPPFVKGPADKPLILKDTVHVWSR